MASRIGKTVGLIIAAPLIAALIVLALPLLFLLFVGRFFGHLWYVGRLRASWPSGKFVLIAYTESQLWAPYIERELLPQLASIVSSSTVRAKTGSANTRPSGARCRSGAVGAHTIQSPWFFVLGDVCEYFGYTNRSKS